jgi:fibronectin type 3 domain-containing protein
MIRTRIPFIVFMFLLSTVYGQEIHVDKSNPAHNLGIKARKVDGDVLLKIVPRQKEAFLNFKQNGWHIERARIMEGDTTAFSRLNQDPIQPASRQRWQEMRDQNDMVGPILQVLYPEQPEEAPQSFVEQMNSDQQLNNRLYFYLFLSADNRAVSRLSGLEFRDENARMDRDYLYRVTIQGYEDLKSHTGERVVETQDLPSSYRAPELRAGNRDSAAMLLWNHEAYKNFFLSYDVERAPVGESFRVITDSPLAYNEEMRRDTTQGAMHYIDSLRQMGTTYQYRLIAHDYFGMDSEPSNVVKVRAMDLDAPPAPEGLKARPTRQGVEVVWDYPHQTADLAGFYVVRSRHSASGPFNQLHEELIATGQKNYVDRSAETGDDYYYAVAAFDTAGNYNMSKGVSPAIADTVPPKPPRGLEARVDSGGLVALRWQMGEADDITGFRVYRSISRDYEFVQATDTPTVYNAYVDTLNLNSLNSKVYYKVVAVDDNWNHSRFSDVLEVTRPDTIAPTKALLTKAAYEKGMVQLEWEPSSSQDVEKQYVMFRGEGQNQWQVRDSLRGNEKDSYSAPLPDTTRSWQVAIQTVDDNGLHSGLSNIRKVVVDSYNPVPPVEDFHAENGGGDQVQLSWETPSKAEKYRLMLYRAQGESQPLLYETLEGDRAGYTDSGLQVDTSYRYQVALKRKSDGVVSQRSEPTKIDLSQ